MSTDYTSEEKNTPKWRFKNKTLFLGLYLIYILWPSVYCGRLITPAGVRPFTQVAALRELLSCTL